MNSGNEISQDRPRRPELLLQIAAPAMIVGLLSLASYLWWGFGVWTFGIGILIGTPLVTSAIVLYLWAVIRDLRSRGLL